MAMVLACCTREPGSIPVLSKCLFLSPSRTKGVRNGTRQTTLVRASIFFKEKSYFKQHHLMSRIRARIVDNSNLSVRCAGHIDAVDLDDLVSGL